MLDLLFYDENNSIRKWLQKDVSGSHNKMIDYLTHKQHLEQMYA